MSATYVCVDVHGAIVSCGGVSVHPVLKEVGFLGCDF